MNNFSIQPLYFILSWLSALLCALLFLPFLLLLALGYLAASCLLTCMDILNECVNDPALIWLYVLFIAICLGPFLLAILL